MPVWMRDDTGKLTWANDAYLKAVEADSLGEVTAEQIDLLEARQRERAMTPSPPVEIVPANACRWSAGGQMNPHDVVVLPL